MDDNKTPHARITSLYFFDKSCPEHGTNIELIGVGRCCSACGQDLVVQSRPGTETKTSSSVDVLSSSSSSSLSSSPNTATGSVDDHEVQENTDTETLQNVQDTLLGMSIHSIILRSFMSDIFDVPHDM